MRTAPAAGRPLAPVSSPSGRRCRHGRHWAVAHRHKRQPGRTGRALSTDSRTGNQETNLKHLSLHELSVVLEDREGSADPRRQGQLSDDLLAPVCGEIRRRLANKSSAAILQDNEDVVAAAAVHRLLVGAGSTSGQVRGAMDAIAGGLTRSVKVGKLRVATIATPLVEVLQQSASVHHTTIATTDLLMQVSHQLRLEISDAYYFAAAYQNRTSDRAPATIAGATAFGPAHWDVDIPAMCNLIRIYHSHRYTPGPTLLDAMGPYVLSVAAQANRPVDRAEAIGFLEALYWYRHFPGERILRAFLTQSTAQERGETPPGISVAHHAAEAKAIHHAVQLGLRLDRDGKSSAQELLRASVAECIGCRDQGDSEAAQVARETVSLLVWCLALEGDLDPESLPGLQLAECFHHQEALTPMAQHSGLPLLSRLYEAVLLAVTNISRQQPCIRQSLADEMVAALGDQQLYQSSLRAHFIYESRSRSGSSSVAHVELRSALMSSSGHLRCQQGVQDQATGLVVDFMLQQADGEGPRLAVVVEAQADHISNQPRKLLASGYARRRLLEASGWVVVPVNARQWQTLPGRAERAAFFTRLVDECQTRRPSITEMGVT